MTWFLAALVVLVLAAAAVVASGRWGEMPELVDDRPASLPPEGPVDAAGLRDVQFSVVPRGYSMTQVDELLERVARQLESAPGQPTGRKVRPSVAEEAMDSPDAGSEELGQPAAKPRRGNP